MYVSRGIGSIADCTSFGSWLLHSECWPHTIPFWQQMAMASAPPPAPSGSVLTVPPASGEDSQATVDALLAAQTRAQQAADRAAVQPVTDFYSMVNQMTGGAFAGGSPGDLNPFSINWTMVALASAAVVGLLIAMRR